MNSLQELWNVYDYVRNPISSIARTATRAIVGPIVNPLIRRSSDIDHDPTARSSNQPLALPDHPASSSQSKVLTKIQVQRRRRLHRDDTQHASSGEGNGQQALNKQAPLVNYGTGVQQIRRGGGNTIKAMAPSLEFKETADDPYVMRQQVR